jgi:hypothetical protein
MLYPYLVTDEHGDYACLDERWQVAYFQPGAPHPEHWEKLYADKAATRDRFAALAQRLRVGLGNANDVHHAKIEIDHCSLEVNILRRFETGQLGFRQTGFMSEDLPKADAIRAFNVLMFFDQEFRRQALAWVNATLLPGGLFICGCDWVEASSARYTVYRQEGGELIEKEFALSIDNIRPLSLICVTGFHDGDPELERSAEIVAVLRGDAEFRAAYDCALDALQEKMNFCPRDSNGYLAGGAEGHTPQEMDRCLAGIEAELSAAGFVERAVATLRHYGYDAWKNCTGHIAVGPTPI